MYQWVCNIRISTCIYDTPILLSIVYDVVNICVWLSSHSDKRGGWMVAMETTREELQCGVTRGMVYMYTCTMSCILGDRLGWHFKWFEMEKGVFLKFELRSFPVFWVGGWWPHGGYIIISSNSVCESPHFVAYWDITHSAYFYNS